jgi:hypothetical protein
MKVFLGFLTESNFVPDLRWLASEQVLTGFLYNLDKKGILPGTKKQYCTSIVSALKVSPTDCALPESSSACFNLCLMAIWTT